MYTRINGVTLIEVMVTMTISVLVLSFILEIYLASQRNYHLQLALNRIQHNATKAIGILSTEIRKAGSIGCARLSQDFPLSFYLGYSLTPANKLSGNGEELNIRYVDYPGAILNKTMQNSSILYATNEIRFKARDKLLISDCSKAEIFQVEHISVMAASQKMIVSQALTTRYEKNAEIGRLVINKFLVAKTRRVNADGTPIYSLFVEDIHHRRSELVEGVYHLAFLYSQMKNGKIIESDTLTHQDGANVVGVGAKLDVAYPPLKKTWYMYVALQ